MADKSYLTAFSDAVLSISATWGILIAQQKSHNYPLLVALKWPYYVDVTAGLLGFCSLAFASFLGCLKFAVLLPHQHGTVTKLHQYFSFLGSCTGLPLLAAAYSMQTRYQTMHNAFVILSIACPLLDLFSFVKRGIIQESASTLSIITILLSSTVLSGGAFNVNGILGSVLFAIAGLAVGTEGTTSWRRLKNVDLFHFVLAFGTISLAAGL
eukprot:gene18678-20562_t